MPLSKFGIATSWVLLVAAAVLGDERVASPTQSGSMRSASTFRLWTDKSGSREATAMLLKVVGETAHLRKPNGKLSIIELNQLSPRDQRYVVEAQRRDFPVSGTQSPPDRTQLPAVAAPQPTVGTGGPPSAGGPFLDRVRDRHTSRLAEGQVDESMSAYLIWIRVSREFLNRYATGNVQWDSHVRDTILGTNLAGSAHTSGTTHLVLKPSRGQALAELIFDGRIDSRTTGCNGPIITHNMARTQIETHKPLLLDAGGLRSLPGNYSAHTWSTTYDIESWLPRLRGRIATRIGWRRAEDMRPQVNEIASQHAAQRLSRAIDVQLSRTAQTLRTVLDNPLLQMRYTPTGEAPKLLFGSTRGGVEIIMYRGDATHDERQLKPPNIEDEPLIAVRVHRIVIRRALTDPEARAAIEPLIEIIRGRSRLPTWVTSSGDQVRARMSSDRQWLMVDLMPGAIGP